MPTTYLRNLISQQTKTDLAVIPILQIRKIESQTGKVHYFNQDYLVQAGGSERSPLPASVEVGRKVRSGAEVFN